MMNIWTKELEISVPLYFFSSIFQGNASVLALVAIFIIFKIQSMESAISSIKSFLFSGSGRYFINEGTVFMFERNEDRDRIIKQQQSNPNNPTLFYLDNWNVAEITIDETSKFAKTSLILLVPVLISSLFGIIFSSSLNKYLYLICFAVYNSIVLLRLGFMINRIIRGRNATPYVLGRPNSHPTNQQSP